MTLHSKQNSRHARVFEILRQNQMADEASNDLRKEKTAPVAPEQIEAFRSAALQSFDRSGAISAKPRRDNKFF